MIKILNAHKIFTENALCLSQRTGWKIETDFQPNEDDLYVVFGAHEIPCELLQAKAKFIILNTEQKHSQFLKNKYYLELMKRNVVFDFNYKNNLDKFNIKTIAHFNFEFIHFENENEERMYDFCFIGTPSDKRFKIINQLKEKYPDKSFYIDFEWKNQDVNVLTNLLFQCKTVLNIPYYEDNALETHRINKALSCGCEVISMPSSDEKMNKIYEKYIHFSTFKKEEDLLNLDKKADYKSLMEELNSDVLPHMLWAIDQIQRMTTSR